MAAAKPTEDLVGVGVLITRPSHQAGNLVRLIEQAGGTAIAFPAIEIVPPLDPMPLVTMLGQLDRFDMAIFVSPNAVDQAFGWLRAKKLTWRSDLQTACVGQASARALERFGVRDIVAPKTKFDSESLLALSALQAVTNKNIVIFRGDGGRELLGETLMQRGATVTYAECYRRARPRVSTAELVEAWRQERIQIATFTSTEAIQNLHDMIDEIDRGWLLHTPTIVLSKAQAAACRHLGFAHPAITAAEASDEAILEAIKTWRLG